MSGPSSSGEVQLLQLIDPLRAVDCYVTSPAVQLVLIDAQAGANSSRHTGIGPVRFAHLSQNYDQYNDS